VARRKAERAAAAALPLTETEARSLFSPLAGLRLLIGLSGGPDSIALTGLLAEAAGFLGIELAAATVDHGLRPESRAEAAEAARFCALLGVPHYGLVWGGPKPQTGLQAAARDARFALLSNCARQAGAAGLVLAHTLDDQAETVLMRIAAGSGIAGLKAMQLQTRREGMDVWRPLLGVEKSQLITTCRSRGWHFAEDPSNGNLAFGRVRIRVVLESLRSEGLTAGALAQLAARAARSDAALEHCAIRLEQDASRGSHALDARQLFEAPMELALRVLARRVAAFAKQPGAHIRLNRLENLLGEMETASKGNKALRRTLSGVLISLTSDGMMQLKLEPQRKRGLR
jgi:tRNA(Ile)-lysidine synthase